MPKKTRRLFTAQERVANSRAPSLGTPFGESPVRIIRPHRTRIPGRDTVNLVKESLALRPARRYGFNGTFRPGRPAVAGPEAARLSVGPGTLR